jgi:proteasome alpha subunit
MSDGRRLIEQAQLAAQEHRVKFQSATDVLSLVKETANIQQYYSQSGGLRPFGVNLLFGGIEDGEPMMFQTTASGMYFRFLARAVGNLSDKINVDLENEYKKGMSNKDAIKLGLSLYKKAMEEDFDLERFDIAYIDLDENLTRLTSDEVKKLN